MCKQYGRSSHKEGRSSEQIPHLSFSGSVQEQKGSNAVERASTPRLTAVLQSFTMRGLEPRDSIGPRPRTYLNKQWCYTSPRRDLYRGVRRECHRRAKADLLLGTSVNIDIRGLLRLRWYHLLFNFACPSPSDHYARIIVDRALAGTLTRTSITRPTV